jgi:hypothetical protein
MLHRETPPYCIFDVVASAAKYAVLGFMDLNQLIIHP